VERTEVRPLITSFRTARPGVKQRLERWSIAFILCGLSLLLLPASRGEGQTSQQPSTAASTATSTASQIISSYEGQNVTAVQVAGRPELATSQFASSFAQAAGQPFSMEKVDQTAAALKAAANCESVRVQVEPEANGARVIFVLEPLFISGSSNFQGPSDSTIPGWFRLLIIRPKRHSMRKT